MGRLWGKRIIDIYLIKEFINPYLVGVAIITIIGLSTVLFEISDWLIVKEVEPGAVLKILLYQLPAIIVETFPAAVLFATISAMSRLNRENEFTALRLGGISLYRLMIPMIIMGILVSVLTFYVNEKVVHWANHQAKNIVRQYVLKQEIPDVQDNVFFKGPEGRLFFVNRYDEKNERLENIVVYEMSEKDEFPVMITAQYGRVLGNIWRLEGGIIHHYQENGEIYQAFLFDSMEYEVASEIEGFYGNQKTPSEMSRKELKRNIDLFQKSGMTVDHLLIEYHSRLSLPVTALIFILIGTPLSLYSKDSRAMGYIFTIVIILAYYILSSVFYSCAKKSIVDPLLAAWIPNMIFGIIGVILLIWREAWQNLVSRFSRLLPLFFILLFFLLSSNIVQADNLKVTNAAKLSYNQELGKYELTGDIRGQYGHFYILADTVTVKMEDDNERQVSRVEEIYFESSKFSGCNLEEPHYYYDAKEVIIYPDDHLIAKHVTFRELNGKLPLFYWPYLYISLKDENQHWSTEIGYSNNRGWFLKATYHYWYQDRLPGELYLDYYTKSGYAGGFKQHFFYEDDLKGYLYLYGQENRTDIPGLVNWEGEISIDNDKNQWKTDTFIKYIDYDNYSYLNGKINLKNEDDTWSMKLYSDFKSKDYYESDLNDDKNLDFDLYYNKKLDYNWKYYLELSRDYKYNIEDGLKQRWGAKTYLARDLGKLDYRITLERDAPYFPDEDDEDEGVTYYRWPELELNYDFNGPLNSNFKLGRYYEDVSKIEGMRGHGELSYNKYWNLTSKLRLNTRQSVAGRIYKVDETKNDRHFSTEDTISGLPYQATYSNTSTLTMNILSGLTWTNRYYYTNFVGQSPFNFDKASLRESIYSSLSYRKGGLSSSLSTTYDIYNQKYSPLRLSSYWKNKKWNINLGTSYDIEKGTFADLVLISRYKDDIWRVNNGLRYDLNNNLLKRIDNQIIYELNDEWYFELNNIYDNLDKEFATANATLKKVFHCRSLTFRYDYIKQEYSLEYNINLFPDNKIKLGSSVEDNFMFDIGLDELLDVK